jgi:hypothetical protein
VFLLTRPRFAAQHVGHAERFQGIAQVLEVVPRDDKLNAMGLFGLGWRVFADDLRFFGQMDFNLELFEGQAIAKVPIWLGIFASILAIRSVC